MDQTAGQRPPELEAELAINPAYDPEAGLIQRVPTTEELRVAYGGKARALHDAGVQPQPTKLEPLPPGEFYVQRSSGEIESGWKILQKVGDGNIEMWKADPNKPDGMIVKTVGWKELQRLKPKNHSATRP